jgi:hypothetical protein
VAGSFPGVLAVLFSGVMATLVITALYLVGVRPVLRARRRVGRGAMGPAWVSTMNLPTGLAATRSQPTGERRP